MFRNLIKKTKSFIQECNSPEIKKLRQEAQLRSGFYNAGYWIQY